MGNRLFYIGMVLGLSTCFLVLFAPCGLIFCGIHYLDKRRDREAAEEEEQRQAHIERIVKLGQDRISASILVDEMHEEAIDPLLPDQPPNTPNISPLSSPIMRAVHAIEEQGDPSQDTLDLNTPELDTPAPRTPEMDTAKADTPKADAPELDTPELDSLPIVSSNIARVPTPPVPSPIPQRNQRSTYFGDGSPCIFVTRRTTPPPPPPNNSPMFSPIRNFLAQGRSRHRLTDPDLEAAAAGLTVPDFEPQWDRDYNRAPRQLTDEGREAQLDRILRITARRSDRRTGQAI
ncbi:hypothetical protein ESCO_005919 [Escovopsis weberi]|uniref:Uncharacterized protein n=1 Tax=Escovopsis weberi TaxID=150374 RepID=A0A0M9VS05_ESCWE|nr:hypothetical protein ESCO_005919 [Escovopsis weberi]